MANEQRRSLTDDQAGTQELDHLHRRINDLDYPTEKRVFENYQALLDDRFIGLMRAGLTITLPKLDEKSDGLTLFFKDRSGTAGTTNHTFITNNAKLIDGATSVTISSDYGHLALRWNFKADAWGDVLSSGLSTAEVNTLISAAIAAATFRISTYLATGTRVTGTEPTALGEYRSHRRTISTNDWNELNSDPGTAPSVANGILIYATGAWAAGNGVNAPDRYDIFVGVNKRIQWEFYTSAGRTGRIDVSPHIFDATTLVGYTTHYDPTLGIATIGVAADATFTSTPKVGIDINGIYLVPPQNVYFDIRVS